MLQPLGFGKVCQPQSESVPSGIVCSNVLANVWRPVASTVKANSPLPTVSGLFASNWPNSTLCRMTSAWRSIGAALADRAQARIKVANESVWILLKLTIGRIVISHGTHGGSTEAIALGFVPVRLLLLRQYGLDVIRSVAGGSIRSSGDVNPVQHAYHRRFHAREQQKTSRLAAGRFSTNRHCTDNIKNCVGTVGSTVTGDVKLPKPSKKPLTTLVHWLTGSERLVVESTETAPPCKPLVALKVMTPLENWLKSMPSPGGLKETTRMVPFRASWLVSHV